jgi:hypothetical protein
MDKIDLKLLGVTQIREKLGVFGRVMTRPNTPILPQLRKS